MATVHDPETVPYVPRLVPEERARRNQAGSRLARLLGNRGRRARAARDARGASEALGPKRVASSRSFLP